MADQTNPGFDPETIRQYKERMEAQGVAWLEDEEDEQSDEYSHFYFIGMHDGREVIYDAVMYTLRLEHESELYEIAEERASRQFPDYQGFTDDSSPDSTETSEQEEEIGMFMAEVIMELEEEGSVKVKEHVDVDTEAEFGIALDIGLHRPRITKNEIETFIRDFNNGTLRLDDKLYSFETESFTE